MGVKVKRYIEKKNSKEIILITESVTFEPSKNIQEYINEFDELVEDGIIKEGKYSDETWVYYTEFLDTININFLPEIRKNENKYLKAYALLKCYAQRTSCYNVKYAIDSVREFLIDSQYLDVQLIEHVQDQIKTWTDFRKRQICFVREYLKFIDTDEANKYLEILKKIKIGRQLTRKLPNYKSIILFEYLMKQFIETANEELLHKYYPVIIWWEVSKVIPMRPIEVVILLRNCIEQEGNEYFINITRRKQKKNGKISYQRIKPLTRIKITKELYYLIKRYIDYANSINDGNKLFSYQVFSKYLSKIQYSGDDLSNKLKEDIVDVPRLNKLLKEFYTEVIQDTYGYAILLKEQKNYAEMLEYEIEHVQLGDTRHIAFCSLILQGYNPLTIARIGGHQTLNEQIGYAGHMDEYVNAYTYTMAEYIANKLISVPVNNMGLANGSNVKKELSSKVNLVKKERMGDEMYDSFPVKGGRCKSKKFPYECTSDTHLGCKHFIQDTTLTQDMINEELSEVDLDIKASLEYIKLVAESSAYFEAPGDVTTYIDQKLETKSKLLNTLIQKKAVIQAYQLAPVDILEIK